MDQHDTDTTINERDNTRLLLLPTAIQRHSRAEPAARRPGGPQDTRPLRLARNVAPPPGQAGSCGPGPCGPGVLPAATVWALPAPGGPGRHSRASRDRDRDARCPGPGGLVTATPSGPKSAETSPNRDDRPGSQTGRSRARARVAGRVRVTESPSPGLAPAQRNSSAAAAAACRAQCRASIRATARASESTPETPGPGAGSESVHCQPGSGRRLDPGRRARIRVTSSSP
jgi:hypothetical protein